MAKETKKVIDVDVSGAETSIKSLKKEMSGLRDTLLNLTKGTADYDKVVKQLQDDQDRIDTVMKAHKKTVDALPGSYNALVKELADIKKQWKETNDEAARSTLGKKALELNNQLKELDASTGNFQRNVGDYKNAFTDAFNSILTGSSNAGAAFTKLGTTMKLSLSTNPIGLVITAITTLIAALRKNDKAWNSIKSSLQSFKPFLDIFDEVIEDIGEALGDIIKALAQTLKPLLPTIKLLLTPIVESVRTIATFLTTIGNSINNIFKNSNFGSAFESQLERIERRFDFINGVVITIGRAFDTLVNGVKSGLNSIASLFSPITSAINNMTSAFDPVINKINDFLKPAKEVYNLLVNSSRISSRTNSVSNYSKEIDNAIKDLKEKSDIQDDAMTTWYKIYQNGEKDSKGNYTKEVQKQMDETLSYLNAASNNLDESINNLYNLVQGYNGTYSDYVHLEEELTSVLKGMATGKYSQELPIQGIIESARTLANSKIEGQIALTDITKLSVKELQDALSDLNDAFSKSTDKKKREKFADVIKEYKKQLDELNKSLNDTEDDTTKPTPEELYAQRLEKARKDYEKWAMSHIADIVEQEKAVERYNKMLETEAKLSSGAFFKDYQEEVQEESINERDPLEEAKSLNDLRLRTEQEYSERYYELLKERENMDYFESQMKLELAGATNEELELLEIEHNQKLNAIDEERVKKQQENFWLVFETYSSIKNDIVNVMSAIGDAWENVLEAQLNTGKISEKDYKRRQKVLQDFQIATIIAQSAASIFDIWAGYAKETGVVNPETAAATGPAAAGVLAALNTKSLVSAIANTAVIGATAVAQIAAVKSKSASKGSSVSAVAIPDSSGSYSGVSYTRNVQTNQEEQAMYSPTRVYVLESDITNAQSNVKVREAESTF